MKKLWPSCRCTVLFPGDKNQHQWIWKDWRSRITVMTFFQCSCVYFLQTYRTEGFLALYKGFIPNWVRLGPWNVIVSFCILTDFNLTTEKSSHKFLFHKSLQWTRRTSLIPRSVFPHLWTTEKNELRRTPVLIKELWLIIRRHCHLHHRRLYSPSTLPLSLNSCINSFCRLRST